MTTWKMTTLLYVPQFSRWAPVNVETAPEGADLRIPIGPTMLIIEPLSDEPEPTKEAP